MSLAPSNKVALTLGLTGVVEEQALMTSSAPVTRIRRGIGPLTDARYGVESHRLASSL